MAIGDADGQPVGSAARRRCCARPRRSASSRGTTGTSGSPAPTPWLARARHRAPVDHHAGRALHSVAAALELRRDADPRPVDRAGHRRPRRHRGDQVAVPQTRWRWCGPRPASPETASWLLRTDRAAGDAAARHRPPASSRVGPLGRTGDRGRRTGADDAAAQPAPQRDPGPAGFRRPVSPATSSRCCSRPGGTALPTPCVPSQPDAACSASSCSRRALPLTGRVTPTGPRWRPKLAAGDLRSAVRGYRGPHPTLVRAWHPGASAATPRSGFGRRSGKASATGRPDGRVTRSAWGRTISDVSAQREVARRTSPMLLPIEGRWFGSTANWLIPGAVAAVRPLQRCRNVVLLSCDSSHKDSTTQEHRMTIYAAPGSLTARHRLVRYGHQHRRREGRAGQGRVLRTSPPSTASCSPRWLAAPQRTSRPVSIAGAQCGRRLARTAPTERSKRPAVSRSRTRWRSILRCCGRDQTANQQ